MSLNQQNISVFTQPRDRHEGWQHLTCCDQDRRWTCADPPALHLSGDITHTHTMFLNLDSSAASNIEQTSMRERENPPTITFSVINTSNQPDLTQVQPPLLSPQSNHFNQKLIVSPATSRYVQDRLVAAMRQQVGPSLFSLTYRQLTSLSVMKHASQDEQRVLV